MFNIDKINTLANKYDLEFFNMFHQSLHKAGCDRNYSFQEVEVIVQFCVSDMIQVAKIVREVWLAE